MKRTMSDVEGLLAPPGVLVVAYGMGVDSTAMLVLFVMLGIRPIKILFADTGSEKPETYAYLPVINAYLRGHGFPEVEVVRRAPTYEKDARVEDLRRQLRVLKGSEKRALEKLLKEERIAAKGRRRVKYTSLEGNCLANKTLPSLAFGRKSCSLKWKRDPQDQHCRRWKVAQEVWKAGGKLIKAIGYDAGPKDARRSKIADDAEYTYWYPLREVGWDRARCIVEIQRAGLPVPVKSACFFCPASQPEEIAEMALTHPDLTRRICQMEDNAAARLVQVEGLWRSSTKRRPGSMAVFIRSLPPSCEGCGGT